MKIFAGLSRRVDRVRRRLAWSRLLVLGRVSRALRWDHPREAVEGLIWGAGGLTLFFLPWMVVGGMAGLPGWRLGLLALLPVWGAALILGWIVRRFPRIRRSTFYLLETALGILHISLILWYAPPQLSTFWFGAFLIYAMLLIVSQSDIQVKPYFLVFSLAFLTPQFFLLGWIKGDLGWFVLQLFLFSFGLLVAGMVYAFHAHRMRERLQSSVHMLEQVHHLWRHRDFARTVEGLLRFTLEFFGFPVVAAFLERLDEDHQEAVALLGAPEAPLPSSPPREVGELLGRLGSAGYLLARRSSFPLEESAVLHLLFFRHSEQRRLSRFMESLLARYLRFFQTVALAQYEAVQVPRDALTGVRTRGFLEQDLARMIRRAFEMERDGVDPSAPYVAVFMMDLDRFKQVNDRYGHAVGDAVLQEFVQRVRKVLRYEDQRYFYRYGGEEFVLLLDACGPECVRQVARRILQEVAQETFTVMLRETWKAGTHELEAQRVEGLPVTVSIGVALFPLDRGDARDLLEQADRYLYEAKRQGRNRAVWHQGVIEGPAAGSRVRPRQES